MNRRSAYHRRRMLFFATAATHRWAGHQLCNPFHRVKALPTFDDSYVNGTHRFRDKHTTVQLRTCLLKTHGIQAARKARVLDPRQPSKK